jgi:hypothetical protein
VPFPLAPEGVRSPPGIRFLVVQLSWLEVRLASAARRLRVGVQSDSLGEYPQAVLDGRYYYQIR